MVEGDRRAGSDLGERHVGAADSGGSEAPKAVQTVSRKGLRKVTRNVEGCVARVSRFGPVTPFYRSSVDNDDLFPTSERSRKPGFLAPFDCALEQRYPACNSSTDS